MKYGKELKYLLAMIVLGVIAMPTLGVDLEKIGVIRFVVGWAILAAGCVISHRRIFS